MADKHIENKKKDVEVHEGRKINLAYKVSGVTIAMNIILAIFKFIAGICGNSAAMISDAIHSLSDVISTFGVIIGVKMSQKKPDKEHPYGHERMECVVSVIMGMLLALTGFGIGYAGIQNIIEDNYSELKIPGVMALVAAVVSIIVKEAMYWYTRSAAKKLSMVSLMADAWHHRSDALSSVGAFIGIFGARMGYPILDSVASIVICAFILKASYDIFRVSFGQMVDQSCTDEIKNEIVDLVLENEKVNGIDMIKTRQFGAKMYVDLEILVDGNMTLFEAHDIAEEVHDEIEKKFEDCKHCMVHVNPSDL